MKDDPKLIAAALVRQYGLEKARRHVLDGVIKAQQQNDNYALSVWRDVKRLLGRDNPIEQHIA